jgi:hypothetical protein
MLQEEHVMPAMELVAVAQGLDLVHVTVVLEVTLTTLVPAS